MAGATDRPADDEKKAAPAKAAAAPSDPSDDLKPSEQIVRALRPYLTTALVFTTIVNLLFLVSPLYMLQVYDRVLTSGSIETLIVLSAIAVFLLLIYIAADGGRRRTFTRAGQLLGEKVDGLTLRRGLTNAQATNSETLTAVGHLAKIQGLLLQSTLAPILDLPFTLLFLAILFAINPILGSIGLGGAVLLLVLALVSDRISRKSVEDAQKRDQRAQNHLSHLVRQRAAIVSMGMSDRAIGRWQTLRRSAVDGNVESTGAATYLASSTRSLRQILQIAILGAGAALAVGGVETPGTIIAGSIIMGRALAPIDQTVALWRQVLLGRKSWQELKSWIDNSHDLPASFERDEVTAMPRPTPKLTLEEFAVGIPGAKQPLLPQVSVDFDRGEIIALLGPSGSGKTSLLQSLAGAWPAHHGTARLGGRDIATWDPRDRGRFIGYLPQHVELLSGTVFENISRFAPCDVDKVYSAAKTVGAHDMILTLAEGYDTMIGEGGIHLSAGQRQAVGLARAMFGDPALLLLDEPTAHLDAQLAANLMARFAQQARHPKTDRPLTAIIATHDVRLINAADKVMIIQNRQVAVMPREQYLRRVSDLRREHAAPKDAVGGTTGTAPARLSASPSEDLGQ